MRDTLCCTARRNALLALTSNLRAFGFVVSDSFFFIEQGKRGDMRAFFFECLHAACEKKMLVCFLFFSFGKKILGA